MTFKESLKMYEERFDGTLNAVEKHIARYFWTTAIKEAGRSIEDAIWEVVKQAIAEDWTPERFKEESANAWEYELKEEAKYAKKQLRR